LLLGLGKGFGDRLEEIGVLGQLDLVLEQQGRHVDVLLSDAVE